MGMDVVEHKHFSAMAGTPCAVIQLTSVPMTGAEKILGKKLNKQHKIPDFE